MKKKAVLFLLVGMLSVTSLTGCGSINEKDVVAKVGDEKITGDIANFYARYMQAQYESYYTAYMGEDMWDSEAEKGKTYEEAVKESVLEELETMIVLEQHMDEYGIELTEAEKDVIRNAAKQFDEANALEDKEKVSGSLETTKRIMTLMAIRDKMTDAIQEKADTEVTDEEAAQKSMQYVFFSYDSSESSGDEALDEVADAVDEAVKKETKTAAQSFAEGAKTASDFAAYATEQGQEAKTATFDKDSSDPAKELVEAADKLKEGETTDLIETDNGCYVARVTSMFDQTATDQKKQEIIMERKQKLYEDTCDKWLKKTDVKVYERVWKKVDFNELSVIMKQDETEPYADEVQTDDVAEQNAQE